MKIKLPTFECLRCGHKWHPKREERPRCCAFCKSPRWDLEGKTDEPKREHDRGCQTCKDI
jgi:hypothetical protein